MYTSPLEIVNLPFNMSAALAKDLAIFITGRKRETNLVRYLTLALHHVSWTIGREARLADYEAKLAGLKPASNFQLLGALSLPTTFTLQGKACGIPDSEVKKAFDAAKRLQEVLLNKNANALELHDQALTCLGQSLAAVHETQLALSDRIRKAVLEKHPKKFKQISNLCPEVLAPDGGHSNESGALGSPALRVMYPNPGRSSFANPEEALQFILKQLSSNGLTGLKARTAPRAEEEEEEEEEEENRGGLEPGGPQLTLFDPQESLAQLHRMPAMGPGEGNAQQRRVLENMGHDTGLRALTEVPLEDPMDGLEKRFPHFKAVTDFIRGSLALAACGEEGRQARIPPLLLRGEPGTGKTYFAQELARVLGTHFVERDLSVTSEAFVLSGMDASWKNSKPGVVFEALVNGKTANPLICLNEIDKVKVGAANNSPIAALYALLEPTSAERFSDEYVPVSLDASRVLWVLTANDGPVPEPILSRLEIFDISRPTFEQCQAIGQSVWTSICKRLLPKGHGFSSELSDPVVRELGAMSPRVMRKALTHAASHAVQAHRKELWAADLVSANSRYAAETPKRSIGFCAQM